MGPSLADIADILETNSIGVVGVNIFYDKEPNSPDDCTTLYNYSSIAPNGYTCNEPERYSMQVRVRSKVHLDGWNTMQSIKAVIDRSTFTVAVSGDDTQYKIVAISLPINLQQDLKSRHILVMNYSVLRYTVQT